MDGPSTLVDSSQARWAQLGVAERVRAVCPLRHVMAADPRPFVESVRTAFRRGDAETLAAEILPLADACRFLEREARSILRPRRLGARGRPLWLWGVSATILREPWGRVLVIAPGNYPLMLPGIQVVQALVAGNSVYVKPAPGCSAPMKRLADALYGLGVPRAVMSVLDEDAGTARALFGSVDKVFLTGSEATGRAILAELAATLTPGVMELSGCDAAFVQETADLDSAARAIAFGLRLNSSATCLAPRRIFVHDRVAAALAQKLVAAVAGCPEAHVAPHSRDLLNELGTDAAKSGATLLAGRLPVGDRTTPLLFDRCTPHMRLLQEDVMAPVASLVRVRSDEDALAASRACGFRLGASVFGAADPAAALAARVDAGCVVVNDAIVPSADPRVPFGGRGRSGFGVTRGAEGLLEMTRPKAICTRGGGPTPHLEAPADADAQILQSLLGVSHGRSIRERARSLVALVRAASRRKSQGSQPELRP